jgi:hypothetical protein
VGREEKAQRKVAPSIAHHEHAEGLTADAVTHAHRKYFAGRSGSGVPGYWLDEEKFIRQFTP